MSDEIIEYQTGKVKMCEANLLIQDVTDMETIEYWEERLTKFKQAFIVTYRKVENEVLYSIYTSVRKKGSAFRVVE